MTTREAFENWAGKGLHLERIPTGAPFAGDYRNIVMQTRWDAWQAATDAALSAPATAPAWNNVPTCEGLWLCDEGDENPYRFTCHDISMPLNPHLVGEGERWYGPIPENTQ